MLNSQRSNSLLSMHEGDIIPAKWFWSFKMRNQALFFFAIIFSFMTAIVTGIYMLQVAIVVPLLQEASFDMYNQQNLISVFNHLSGYKGIVDGIFNINIHQVQIIHQIYTQSYRNLNATNETITLDYRSHMDYCGTKRMPRILVNQPPASLDRSHSFMCYTNKTNISYPMDKQTLINLKIQEQMYSIGQILDATNLNIRSLFYCGLLDEPQVYFGYPCTSFGSSIYNLNIPKRPWFLKGISIYNQTTFEDYDYQFTEPFLQFTRDKIEVTLVLPLIDKFKQLKGVIASDLGTDLNKYIVRSDENVYMALLADQKGLLIYHSYQVDLSLLPIYIYNTSITGFTYDDWIAITNTSVSNCPSYSSKARLLCRYNSFYNKEIVIQIMHVKKFNFILMIFHDNSDFIQYSQDAVSSMIQTLQDDAIENIKLCFIIISITIAISFTLLIVIFIPIQNLISHCEAQIGIKSVKQLQKFINNKNKLLSDWVVVFNQLYRDLYNAYTELLERLNHLSYRKGDLCKEIENRDYPTVIKQRQLAKLIEGFETILQENSELQNIAHKNLFKMFQFYNQYKFQYRKLIKKIFSQFHY